MLGASIVTFDPRKWVKFFMEGASALEVPMRNHQPILVFLLIVLSISVAFFFYIENLYSDAPGINPDSFLTAMPFYQMLRIGGFGLPLPLAWICLIPFLSLSLWLGHWIVGGLILGFVGKITLKTRLLEDIKSVPIFFIPLALSQLLCSLVYLIIPIGPDHTYEFFLGMFWFGFILSFLYAMRFVTGPIKSAGKKRSLQFSFSSR